MRILHLLASPFFSGPAESVALLALAQRALGHEVSVAVDRKRPGLTVCVHPSHGEAYSMALLEALACGCCVVASRLPNMMEVIEHGRTGFLFEPGDVEGLRALLRHLLAHPQEAERVGRQAAAEARRRFGVEHEASHLGAAYGTLWEG